MTAASDNPFPREISSGDGTNANEISDELAELYRTRIEPIIKRQLAAKLRASLRASDETRQNEDALELLSETKLLVLKKFCPLYSQGIPEAIRDLDAYISVVTSNVFNQYLRRRYPRRLTLKNQFRYLLTHHDDLALWEGKGGEWLCGYRSSRSRPRAGPVDLSREQRDVLISRVNKARFAAAGRELIELAKGLFDILERPANFDDLVATACQILEIEEPTQASEIDTICENRSAIRPSALSDLEDGEYVHILWKTVLELPLRHRAALLLNFNRNDENLISMLPGFKIASIRAIAKALGFSDEEFAAVWNELPWDDNRIGERFGLTRQQVVNLRHSARNTMRRKLRMRND
jgi:hypothetical protein